MSTQWYTQQIRANMKRRRWQKNNIAICDMCGKNPGTEWHHIVTRYSVMGCEHDKIMADNEFITALLCHECHETIDTDANRETLLQKLYYINGSSAVNPSERRLNGRARMQAVIDKFEHPIGFTLPEVIYGDSNNQQPIEIPEDTAGTDQRGSDSPTSD